jgi:hypothetical protein
MISVSENFLVESEWFILQNKICPFLAQGICIWKDVNYITEREIKELWSFFSIILRSPSGKFIVFGSTWPS